MATKPRRRRAIASAATRVHHRARGLFASHGGSLMASGKTVLVGGIGQVAATIGNNFMPPWGGIVGLAAAGHIGKNETLLTLSGMHLAAQVPIPGVTTSGSSGGTNWL